MKYFLNYSETTKNRGHSYSQRHATVKKQWITYINMWTNEAANQVIRVFFTKRRNAYVSVGT